MRPLVLATGVLLASPASAQLGPLPNGPTISLPPAASATPTLNVPSNPSRAFFTDRPIGGFPSVVRLGDRVTIGQSNSLPLTTAPSAVSWAGSAYSMGWMELQAALAVNSGGGGAAIAALSRASDSQWPGIAAAFGLTTFAVADTPNAVAEGAYHEARTTNTTASAYAMEVDAVNNAGPISANPYFFNPGGGAYGLAFGAGGDPSIGNTVYPSQWAVGIGHNKTTWQRGIVFESGGLLGDDGTTGTGVAIEMAKGHQLQWVFDGSDTVGGYIRSDSSAAGVGIVFTNTGLTLRDGAGNILSTWGLDGGLVTPAIITTNVVASGNIHVGGNSTTGYPTIDINGAAGSQRQTTLSSGGALRWAYGASNAESGANTGGDFFFSAFGDNGAFLGNDLTINRATGQVSVPSKLAVGGPASFSSGLTTTSLTVSVSHTPATSTEACTTGQRAWDTNYDYVCVATNSWKRAVLSAW